jgi:putative transposase
LVVPGYPHHITQRGVRRQTTFFDERDYRAYLGLAKALLADATIEIWTYCLMPNHMHAVVVPQHPNSLATFFGAVHKTYAELTNRRYDWSGHLWQNRFFSVVMDEHHTLACLRYVELNPVRSGLVTKASDWPWSSARGNLRILDDPLIPERSALRIIPDWHAYLARRENETDLRALRKTTCTGRPDGDAKFIRRVEDITGRRVRRRRSGRKKKWGD